MSHMQTLKGCAAGPLFVLAGCVFLGWEPEEPPPPGETEEAVPPAADRYPYAPLEGITAGAWVRYTSPRGDLAIKVLEKGPSELILEIQRGADRSLQRVRPDGTVIGAWWMSGSEEPKRQPLEAVPPSPAPDRQYEGFERTEEKRIVGGRTIPVQVLRRKYFDIDGALQEEVYVCSREVPPLVVRTGDAKVDAKIEGGLVESPVRGGRRRLVDFGTDAKPPGKPYPWRR